MGAIYPVVDGLPVLLRDDVEQTIGLARASLDRASGRFIDQRAPELFIESLGISEEEKAGVVDLARRSPNLIDPVVSYLVGATNGIAYKHLLGKLDHYPIPSFPLEGNGQLLDLGCSWGRWTLAAAKRGFEVVGLDPSLGALMAARRVSAALGTRSRYVCGDARFLPFRDESFDVIFSYSVLQHLSEPDVEVVLREVARVLRPGGVSLIQMPNRIGLRCLYHQVRRGFRAPRGFEVRYWSMRKLHETFGRLLGESTSFVDCFFGLGLQKADMDLMPVSHRVLIGLSEVLKGLSRNLSILVRVADSVFVLSRKAGESLKSVASIRYIG
jgi:SAM-dependent methyltransferase